jgi:hypothetical protein
VPVLQYDFRVVGVGAVHRALASVEKRFAAHNASMNRATGTRAGARAVSPAAAQAAAARAAEKQAAVAIRAEQRVEAARIKQEHRVAREREKLERQYYARQLRNQKRAALAENAARERGRKQFARSTVGTAGRAARGALGGAATLAGGALAIGGGFAVSGAIQRQLSVEKQAAALANQAYREGGGPSREQIKTGVMQQAQTEGVRTGLGAEGMIGGLRQVTAVSGRLDIGQQLMGFMGDIANATDAGIEDVGRTVGQIVQSLAAKGTYSDEDIVAKTRNMMLGMAGQAKVGSIEFGDLAQNMGKVMSSTAGFAGEIDQLVISLGAMSQLAVAGGASSAEEAMTAIMRFRDDLIGNQDRFKSAGVNVWADKGRTKIRDPMQIVEEVLSKTGGDLSKADKLFGIRSMKAFQPFQEAFVGAGGGEAGSAAVMKLLSSVTGAKMSEGELKQSSGFRVSQGDRQFAIAMENLNSAMGEKLLPVLTEMIPKFAELVPLLVKAAEAFAKFVKWIGENPYQNIGLLIAGKITADIAAAAIGSKVSAALVRLIGGAKVPPVPGGGGGGGAGGPRIGGAAMGGVGMGLAVGGAILAHGIGSYEGGQAGLRSSGEMLNTVRSAGVDDLPEVQRIVEEQRRRATDEKKSVSESVLGKTLGGGVANLLDPDRESRTKTQDAFLAEMEEKFRALQVAADKLRTAADSVSSVTPNRGNGPSPVK